mgnify:CR=1 FL=1|tara:strand:+ start:34290 stop:35780 length:1491 start_codon:yes stop_codon:yes gene_type:complete
MTPEKFESLKKQGFNRIPVTREVLADLDTPLSVYLKLVKGPFGYLFESVQGGEKWGRYSIIGLPCKTRIKITGYVVSIENSDGSNERFEVDDPLKYIEEYHSNFNVPEQKDMPRFLGGLVGYFGYDTISFIEKKLSNLEKRDPLKTPDIFLMVSDELIIFDNLSGRMFIVVHADISMNQTLEDACKRINEIHSEMKISVSRNTSKPNNKVDESDFISEFSEGSFKSAVKKIKKYINDGDCMQVVLSQRLSIPFLAEPLDLYRALRGLNPSPYMYFIDLGEFQIVGSSPEILVRLEDDEITVRPIAGTRRRGHTKEEDLKLEKELLSDPKELAEHLMLIDLGRNDAGRIAEVGTVKLTNKMEVERYSHVMHIVSNVIGKLRKNKSFIDVIKAVFPAGTVSGAPKIRAMEIIDEIEPVRRGIYSGAIGYFAWNGNMDTAIAIRTAIIKDKKLHIQAGAGIVADSVPDLEWKETLNKGRAVFKAVSLAEAGLDSGQEGK